MRHKSQSDDAYKLPPPPPPPPPENINGLLIKECVQITCVWKQWILNKQLKWSIGRLNYENPIALPYLYLLVHEFSPWLNKTLKTKNCEQWIY